MNVRCGMDPLGSMPTPFRNRYSKPPMNALPSANARLYPYTAQSSVMSAIIAKDCISVPSTFLFLTSPP